MQFPEGWMSEPFSSTDDRFLVIKAPYGVAAGAKGGLRWRT